MLKSRDYKQKCYRYESMGAVTFSIDLSLVNCLQQSLPLVAFVETGTFEGDSIEQVKTLFEEIYSIELSETYYAKILEKFKKYNNIKLYQGSSEKWLHHLHHQLKNKSTLYWLDAHWCVASDTAGVESQCPLLKELEAIDYLNSDSIVIIDDARLFLCPPPEPHEISQWPSFDEIIKTLYRLSSLHSLIVVNDVIIYYPQKIDQQIKNYAYFHGIDWLVAYYKSERYDQILQELEEKEQQIQGLDKALRNILQESEEKEKQIHLLAMSAQDRLKIIEELDRELTKIKGIQG